VVSVLGLEQRNFGATPQEFYILGLERGGKLMLPIGNVGKAGVRDLVSATKARELLAKVTTEPEEIDSSASWKERAATYTDGLKSGSADRYTEILQELLFRARSAKLSSNDKNVLETARGYFVGEIAAALDRSSQEIAASLDEPAAASAS
jgi:RNA polymerase-interacting CarD/CdnL/TRCF family regulator